MGGKFPIMDVKVTDVESIMKKLEEHYYRDY